ncbi:bifunctional diguanylate cyclase/phosphodiesterase [Mesorhizobium sp. CA13]|uniref:putative bifunctional diguanylate cyclase/phosphodiesterase n=1 Tax=unclassified Mesorhizobium TaxID=325217 RepID=UPI00112CF481|nr:MULTISPECIES: bifunctional diguanylate cyclase/phosphodiesterase [unclassified Mesorhizobium]MBZ9855103.1 bifunctional diguanylate cyclase/phosphodiesterase [Mesorhizobium sp. CA13]MCA0016003.1 bifunctional diguanylate cyclase/phosphodiesterase [Mesorhizobium sp. B294B1A1]MCA0038782.1 bifunctional diguanylate cyclase/phosphodiesterase [Mesorhizobium sp. B292B1B]TPM47713.1 bifunctional diguanylate cyclase/phosphodiesterase [Mesorhizobium sp. B2-3-2]
MPAVSNPNRTPVFRLITIASSGIGSFILGIWGLKHALGDGFAGMPADVMVAIMAALCALAAAGAAMSFFAGVDESADFVFNETQFDKLTGLLARPAMVGKIAEAACATSRTGAPMFLIDIDIDRFKQINDAIGYSQGDELIRAFTKRLQACVPERVLIGRIGAGEFAVLLPDHQIQGTMEAMVERLIDEMMEPYELSSHQQSVSLSVGIVAMPKDGVDPVLILRRSNLALQNARARGVGNWSVFDTEMGRVADHRQWVESELHIAFERGDFDLHYQPQLDLPSGRIVGYEALIRWNHPERGMIPPLEFIQIAEETGMINPIGEWVLRKACSDARHLPDDCFVAVNISPVQFMTKDFIGLVRDTMRTTGIKPSRLELEVTETAMMQDRDRAAAILKELADMGISVAVDDFGTGYSNLSYLIDFSFGKLKIDRSFVSRIDTDSSSGAVVSTIVGLSRALGVSIIAEGVETEDQATLLRAAGCEVVQGYLFGRPAPLAVMAGAEHVVEDSRRVANLH